jgi:hypothetical protein
MQCATTVRTAALTTAVCLGSAAYADSVCEKGSRETTASERDTMMSVLEAAKAALPRAPEGWIIGGYEELSIPQSFCTDTSAPLGYGVARTFNRTDDQEQRDEALTAAGTQLRAQQEARQPQMEALMARLQALGAQMADAAQKGDSSRSDALAREFEQIQKELESSLASGNDEALIEQVAVATMKDVTMSIAVRVNPVSVGRADMQPAAPPPGAHAAFAWTESDEGIDTAHTLVLVGAWQPRSENGIASQPAGSRSIAAAHAIAVDVAADPARLDSLFGSIDFSALAATVAR